MNRVKNVLSMYRHANHARNATSNVKWRVLMVLLLVASILVIREYVTNKYAAEMPNPAYLSVIVADKVVYWLVVGVMIGIMFAWLMNEGEMLISLWKFASRLERETVSGIERAAGIGKPARKAPARRRKKRR